MRLNGANHDKYFEIQTNQSSLKFDQQEVRCGMQIHGKCKNNSAPCSLHTTNVIALV